MRRFPLRPTPGISGSNSGSSAWRLGPFSLAPQRVLSLVLSVLLFANVLSGWMVPSPAAYAAGRPTDQPASLTFQKFLQLSHRSPHFVQPKHYPPVPGSSRAQTADYAHLPPSVEPASMKPISQVLDASFTTAGATGKSLDLLGSDGRLEVVIQPGSLDLSHATVTGGGAPTGSFIFRLTQVHGHFVGLVNGLGGYEVQLVDGQGRTISGIVLRSPITFIYHYQPWEMTSLGLDPGHLLMIWPAQVVAAQKAHQPTTPYFVVLHNNAQAHTLTGQSTVLSSGPLVAGTGTPDDQSPPAPHLASVGGNSGQLSFSYPIRVPPGPAGFAPQLLLNYSSSEPNGRHSCVSPASDVGDGWTLNLGSVTAQIAPAGSPGNPGSGSYTWYFLNDVANVSDRLVPGSTSGFYETEHVSRLLIQQVTQNGQPCFKVWDKDGTYYEFGCTTDSLQYWTDSSGTRNNYRWDLNKIIAPNENAGVYKITKVTYQQDITHDSNNYPTVRDAGIQQIIYGYSSDANSVTNVVGTVDFTYLAPPYSSNHNCSSAPPDGQSTTLRCDDPLSRTNAGITVPPPLVMSTMTLTQVASYVGSDSNGNQEAYRYDFSYQDSPFTDCYDDYTQYAEDCAGEHLLTTVKPYVYQNGTAHQMPKLDLSYSGALVNNYYDSQEKIQNGTQQYGQQTYWSYLTRYVDTLTGVGGTITYATAHNNAHGTPNDATTGDDRHDPLYCSTHSDCTGNYNYPDDHAWSMQVVTSITALGKDSSAPALNPAQTTYTYRLAITGAYSGSGTWCYPAGSDQDCVGDNWIPSIQDNNWQDYYDAEFRGFNDVTINGPASGEMRVDAYFSTKGWGTSESDGGNYNSGHLYEEDVYGPYGYQGGPVLLSITANTYTSTPNSCFGTSLNSIYNPCEVMITKSRTTTYDTTSNPNPNAPWIEHDYTYDDFNGTTGLTSGYHNLLDDQVFTSNGTSDSTRPTYTHVLTYIPNKQTGGTYVYYDVNKVSSSEIDDNTGKVWQCQDFTYDEGVGTGVLTPDAGWLTTTKSYSDCTNKSGTAITTYQGYDQYGNLVATVDGVGTAHAGLYSSNGCTLSTAPAIFTSSSNWSAGRYTSCTTYTDGGTTNIYESVPLTTTNAFGFQSSTTYDYTQGALPLMQTDINGQQTSTSYSFGSGSATNGKRAVSVSLPGEAGSYTTQSNTFSTCTSSSSLPCFEIDSNSSQYSGAIKRTFYDSLGRQVETRTPGPGTYDTIVFTTYNDQSHSVFTSVPFQVARATTWVDPNGATDYTGVAPGGTVVYDDTLGRTLAYQDPAFGSPQEPGINCSSYLMNTYTGCTNYVLGGPNGDSTSYEATQTVDANSHSVADFTDALGRTRYTQWYSGNPAGYTGLPANTSANEQKKIQYNALGKATSIVVTDLSPQSGQSIMSVTATASYDDMGRLTGVTDPDRGSHSYSYDANSQLLTDVSGSRTLGYSYDLLGRVGCVQDQAPTSTATGACTSGANPLVQNTYDADPPGVSWSGTNYAGGRLTQSLAINYFPGPDFTQGKVTENRQYDQRGRMITQRLQLTATGGSLTFPTLPTFQQALTYNDVDQLVTSTTSTTPSGQGYTFTNVYDSTGNLSGLSNNGTATANLATLSYSTHALVSQITFLASDGSTSLALDEFSYDANLRPLSTSASWQSGGGTIFSQARTYDPAGNVVTLTTTQAVVPNTTNSGGSETEAFCYDEQNRLVWAGNTGTPPSAGSGTCGSGPSNSLSGAGYNNSYVYTHLGQLWQGPYNGNGSYQYLYCNSSQPHQLTGLYPTGTTCSTTGGKTQTYGAQYDSWGNLTTRTATGSGSTTATLFYDGQDHLVRWNDTVTTTNEEWYMYDGAGQRILRRSQTGTGTSNTKYTVYAFGIQDDVYDGSGTSLNNRYYYSLAGRLIGELTGGATKFLLTDMLGSVVASISNTVSSAAVLGNQVYGPYGNNPYSKGTISTPKGYTGQYNDGLTQLDYYNARYYDPFVGVFLSVDSKQGNLQGMNPYAYVGGNPETRSDPTGQRFIAPPQGPPMSTTDIMQLCGAYFGCANKVIDYNLKLLGQSVLNGLSYLAVLLELIPAAGEALMGNPEPMLADEQQFEELSTESAELQLIESEGCSFTAETVVDTHHGKQAIGKVRAGEQVLAYNPQTRKMEWQPIMHVWIHQDNDLVDLTITTPAQTPTRTNKHSSPQTHEIVHTNKKHPFFTMEKGFLPVGQIKVGMHVLRADGRIGIVTAWVPVPGVQTMYNLEVAQDHTFTVGSGEWIVHNCAPSEFSVGINKLLSSSNLGEKQEAMIAKLAEDENFTLTDFRSKVFRSNNTLAGDIDVGTAESIVESKTGDELSKRDLKQLQKLLGQGPDGQYVNPGGKRTLIYYAPSLNQKGIDTIENAGGYVAQNPQQLIALLAYFDPSWS